MPLLLPLPIERALLPDVSQRDHEGEREHEHGHVTGPPELAQQHGPRVDEHGLDVEDDEQQRHEVELHPESVVRRADRLRAALERARLLSRRAPWSEQRREPDQHRSQNSSQREDHREGKVALKWGHVGSYHAKGGNRRRNESENGGVLSNEFESSAGLTGT